jgi:hypothetical protein
VRNEFGARLAAAEGRSRATRATPFTLDRFTRSAENSWRRYLRKTELCVIDFYLPNQVSSRCDWRRKKGEADPDLRPIPPERETIRKILF